jgi:hypothetical protein
MKTIINKAPHNRIDLVAINNTKAIIAPTLYTLFKIDPSMVLNKIRKNILILFKTLKKMKNNVYIKTPIK